MGDSGTPPPKKPGGVAFTHEASEALPVFAAPSTKGEKNTIRTALIPVACWRVNDVRFEFGSSFLLPDVTDEFTALAELSKSHPGSPMSIFGHADPVGDETFNKTLSGRRSEAVYGVLTRDVDRWEKLYSTGAATGDNWGQPAISVMENSTGKSAGTGSEGRKALFKAYMDFLCKDSAGAPFVVPKAGFLGKGTDAGGKADFQGCSEFNPVLVFSASEQAEFNKPENQAARNEENGKNRRVVVYLFRPDAKVANDKWPCPRTSEGISGCQKRMWSDATKRRSNQAARREFPNTKDTFGCRFYHRLAVSSPCEGPGPVSVSKIKLTKVDERFAPSVENLDIAYDIEGFAGKNVKLVIEGEHYKGKTLFERPLTAQETADGTAKPLKWDGKIGVGDRKDRFAHPLLGPFKVKLVHDGGAEELPFKILYHSVELAFGKHTADGKPPAEADQLKFAAFQLNELGYDGGVVEAATAASIKKALVRFQRANYKAGTQTLLAVTGTLDADTLAVLKTATARQIWETGKTPLTADSKFYVHDNFMNDPTMNFVTGNMPEFNSFNRKTHAEDKMDRPFLPLEAEIKLWNKAGAAVSAPEAVGPAHVAFEMSDGPEDATIVPATNASAQTYTKHAREIGATASVGGAARIDASGDNALDTFDGFRERTAAEYVKAMFPNSADSKLEPYKIEKYDKVSRGTPAKDVHFAQVNAWDDAAKFPERRGRAGAYFRFSTKGGDDAKVRVGLTFQGLPNKDFLETEHKPREADLFKETGRWTVWRRTRISAYCTQVAAPPRTSGLPDFGVIRDRWAEAFIEVENNGTPVQTLTYSTIVTEAVYKATIMAMPASHRPAGVTNANLIYRPDAVYGGAIPTQSPGQSATNYCNTSIAAMTAWCVNPINALLKVIHDEARKTSPEGFVIFDFRLHPAITGQLWNAATNSFDPDPNPAVQNRIGTTAGYVRCAGAVTMNVDNPFNVNCYLMHECGHARFLYHHETQNNGVTDNPTHHDHDQRKCTMSYGIGADTPDQWRYPFCGKCLLRLRGWKVTGLPRKYTA